MATELDLAAQRRLIEALRDPARYPHPVTHVSVIETHISFVLLTGSFAYKIKKAVDLGFVDYTRLESRHFFCEEELRLNRRLAPQLYLAAIRITGSTDDPIPDGAGETLEYAVQMTEFSQHDLLDQVMARDALTPAHVDTLAGMLAEFHKHALPVSPALLHGAPQSVHEPVADNFNTLQSLPLLPHPQLDTLQAWCEAEYHKLEPLLTTRRQSGWIRECHGDLHLGNMLLFRHEPLVFDCIEFNPALRWIDVISDLAFLTMDLTAHGRPDYAWRLLNGWLEITGDHTGLSLLRYYQVYRALVRAKVAGLRAIDTAQTGGERQAARNWMTNYLDQASRLACASPRALILMHGFSGSGKSSLARMIAEHIGAICVRSDVERKRMHGLPALVTSGSAINAGLYTETATRATHDRLAALTRAVLEAGYPVLIDASNLQKWQRDGFSNLANLLDVPFLILDCQAPETVLRQRISSRRNDVSEATLAVLAQQLQEADPLDAQEQQHTITIDTTRQDLQATLADIRRHLH